MIEGVNSPALVKTIEQHVPDGLLDETDGAGDEVQGDDAGEDAF